MIKVFRFPMKRRRKEGMIDREGYLLGIAEKTII